MFILLEIIIVPCGEDTWRGGGERHAVECEVECDANKSYL